MITPQEAAERLDVAPEQMAVWSERFGWPLSDADGDYRAIEIDALAVALESSVSLSGAIARARRATGPRRSDTTVNFAA